MPNDSFVNRVQCISYSIQTGWTIRWISTTSSSTECNNSVIVENLSASTFAIISSQLLVTDAHNDDDIAQENPQSRVQLALWKFPIALSGSKARSFSDHGTTNIPGLIIKKKKKKQTKLFVMVVVCCCGRGEVLAQIGYHDLKYAGGKQNLENSISVTLTSRQ